MAANAVSGVMNFLGIVLTIRYLSPEDFGTLTVAVTTMQLVGMLSNAGLNESLMSLVSRTEGTRLPEEISRSLSGILRLRLLVLAVVITGGLLLAAPISEGLFRQPALAFPLSVGMLGACGISLCQFSATALQALRSYERLAIVSLVRFASLLLALGLLVGLDRLDLTSALIAHAAAPFLAFTVSLGFLPIAFLTERANPIVLFRRIWNYSKWVVVLNLCSMFFSRLEIYLLTAFASAADLGIYSAAFKLCGGILLVEAALTTVLFPELSRLSGSANLAPFVRRCLGPLVVLMVVLYGLGLLASPFIPLLLGERYAASVPLFQILLAARVGLIPLVPLNLLFYVTDRTRAGALSGLVQLSVLLSAGFLLIPAYGALGAAWTQVLVTGSAVLYLVSFAWPYLSSLRMSLGVKTADVE